MGCALRDAWDGANPALAKRQLQRLAAMLAAGLFSYVVAVAAFWYLSGKPAGAEFELLTVMASRIRRLRMARVEP